MDEKMKSIDIMSSGYKSSKTSKISAEEFDRIVKDRQTKDNRVFEIVMNTFKSEGYLLQEVPYTLGMMISAILTASSDTPLMECNNIFQLMNSEIEENMGEKQVC